MQDDLFGETAPVSRQLEKLWDLQTAAMRTTAAFLKVAIAANVWNEGPDDFEELQYRAHYQEIKEFVHARLPNGRKRAYKTDKKGGIMPGQLALKIHRLFDLRADCEGTMRDREKIRQDIRAYYLDFNNERPTEVPLEIWSDEDHEDWMRQRGAA